VRRVLLIGDYPPPYGGLSVQIAALRGRLAERGDTEVRVLDIGSNRRRHRADCLPTESVRAFAGSVLRHLRRGFIAHVHTNGHNRKSWLLALAATGAGLLAGRRTVLSLGSGRVPEYLAETSAAGRAVARAAVRAAGAVIVRNERARAAVTGIGAPPAAVVILPGFYGVGASEIGAPSAEVEAFALPHRPLLGAIASPGPQYGIALLVDATARLRARHPRAGLVLVGPDPVLEDNPSWILSLAERERPELLAVMRALDVFVRPTYFDGDACSVREALALGVRVVASDTDFRPDGVRRFPPGDADALAAAIDAALDQPAHCVDSTALPALLALYDRLPLARGRARAAVVGAAGSVEVG